MNIFLLKISIRSAILFFLCGCGPFFLLVEHPLYVKASDTQAEKGEKEEQEEEDERERNATPNEWL